MKLFHQIPVFLHDFLPKCRCKSGRRGWINCRSDEQSCIYNTQSFPSHEEEEEDSKTSAAAKSQIAEGWLIC